MNNLPCQNLLSECDAVIAGDVIPLRDREETAPPSLTNAIMGDPDAGKAGPIYVYGSNMR